MPASCGRLLRPIARMPGLDTATALVISPTPATLATREFFVSRFGPGTAFSDLAGLRRSGIRSLRRCRARTVVATAPADELHLFVDYLAALAFLVPGARRERQVPPEEAVPLGALDLFRSACRLTAGLLVGPAALVANATRASWLGRLDRRPRGLAGARRCLYLKPTLSFGSSVGGSVAHVAGVANALARAGIEVRLLSAQEQPLVAPPCVQRAVPPEFLISFPFEVNSHRYQSVFLRAAREEAGRERPDFIYQRHTLNDLSGVLLAEELGVPLVLEFNGSEVWVQRHWGERLRFERLARQIERACLRRADLVVVVSQPLVEQAASLGAEPERVLFYPNGIDPGTFDPALFGAEDRRSAREGFGVPVDADLLTFVGTFGTWHGTDVLALAIRRLIDEQRVWLSQSRVHFLFVGDGARGPRVREILGADTGGPFVTLAGMRPQAETPRTLAASDVLLSPHVPNPDGTPFFGSPTKLFEYMAMAKPIVASDLDQIGWVLKGWRPGEPPPGKGQAGRVRAAILIEPGSVDSLVAGIRQAVELRADEREALGTEARQLVTESFTWDRNVAAVLARLSGRGRDGAVT
jgi:glycosyltransferase involved in cell wall biosynthesis